MPVFEEGAIATRLVAENTEGRHEIPVAVSATDADGHRLTYSLGGPDVDSFALDPRSGRLRTREGVNYDHETRDRYSLTIGAEDGHGGRATMAVVVEVTDVPEPPSAPDKPTVSAVTRTSLTAQWTTPANTGPPISDYDGQYRRGGSGSFEAGWDRISAVNMATISGLAADTLYEVQVRARNAEGTSDWSDLLEVRTQPNRAPVFNDGSAATRRLEENTAAGVNVGDPVAATDADGDDLAYGLEQETAFVINSSTGHLMTLTGATYDFETQSEHDVTVQVDDGHGGTATTVVTVQILDVDESLPTANAGGHLTVSAGGTAWLDGTGSGGGEGAPTYSWSFVSWPGDSAPAITDATTLTPSFVATNEGTYVVRLTVTLGGDSDSDDVSVVARASTEAGQLVKADLLVDTDRDGTVDSADEVGEEIWTAESGAVFGANADDDDNDGVRDGWDSVPNGDADLLDMAPVVVRRIPGLHSKHSVVLEMAFSAGDQSPRLFYTRADGGIELLIGGGNTSAELPVERLVAGDLRLYLESYLGRDRGFDGQLSLTLIVREGDVEASRDAVAMRGSPVLFSDHLQVAERVFVVDKRQYGGGNNEALVGALEQNLPGSVDLYRVRAETVDGDIWIQDSMQTSYVLTPPDDDPGSALVHTELNRFRGLRRFLADQYLGPGTGYAATGGTYRSTFDMGGNVEVIPPHTHDGRTFPYGRIVIGGDPADERSTVGAQIDFFNAQEMQSPPIVVDAAWLAVGHVDEIFTVVPNRNAGSEARSWAIAIASPELAVELLEQAVADGAGDAPVFEGRGAETTPEQLLADTSLMAVNETAQSRIDTVRAVLVENLGLADSDFRELPALFWSGGGATDMYVALMPAMQNLLVVNSMLFVPDPEGPVVAGEDIWRKGTIDALDGLGLTTHFVDVYNSYHLLWGGIHCGTNVERQASTSPWWRHVETEEDSE